LIICFPSEVVPRECILCETTAKATHSLKSQQTLSLWPSG